MAGKKKTYDNDSITSLKGADRVRKRPGVIFGSDGLEGCQHSFFEILSNSIDEAREGYGNIIEITRFLDHSIEIRDHGRGIPLDFNEKEGKYNWELVFCELYAGGKYDNNADGMYEYSLGLNGLGACATQYSSEFMDVCVERDKTRFKLHFEKGEVVGELSKEPIRTVATGTVIRWRPDIEVFTDINISVCAVILSSNLTHGYALFTISLILLVKCLSNSTFSYSASFRNASYILKSKYSADAFLISFLQCFCIFSSKIFL